MKLINQKSEYWPQKDLYRQIERCARVCYKSEDKITEDSAKKMVDRLIQSKHLAMLEHGTVYLKREVDMGDSKYNIFETFFEENPYSKVNYDGAECCVTTNLRVIVENCLYEYMEYQCEPTKFHDRRYTMFLTTSIGIVRELLRHRKFSFANESTRYVSSCSKRDISEFDCDNLEDITAAYIQGFSMREIAEQSSASESTIYSRLKQNNVPIRGLHSTGHREEDFFSYIDTPEKAYLIGLIQTDGSIAKSDRSAYLSITQHKDYAWYIRCMLQCFSNKVTYFKNKDCMQMQIGSKRIVEDLMNIGIVPNKTRHQTDEDIKKLWNSIPEEYKGDFIRGLIDGDGWVSYFVQKRGVNESCNIGFCSVKESLIDYVISYIKENFAYSCGKSKDGAIYKLYITDKNKSIEIGKHLYKNFKYPFGHPKKATTWIKRLRNSYNIADFKDEKFIVVRPGWVDLSNPKCVFSFIKAVNTSEDTYTSLRLHGLKPQQAREVLPLATKSDIVMTGFKEDWKHFFDLRLYGNTGAPHPDMKVLAQLIKDEFIKNNIDV